MASSIKNYTCPDYVPREIIERIFFFLPIAEGIRQLTLYYQSFNKENPEKIHYLFLAAYRSVLLYEIDEIQKVCLETVAIQQGLATNGPNIYSDINSFTIDSRKVCKHILFFKMNEMVNTSDVKSFTKDVFIEDDGRLILNPELNTEQIAQMMQQFKSLGDAYKCSRMYKNSDIPLANEEQLSSIEEFVDVLSDSLEMGGFTPNTLECLRNILERPIIKSLFQDSGIEHLATAIIQMAEANMIREILPVLELPQNL